MRVGWGQITCTRPNAEVRSTCESLLTRGTRPGQWCSSAQLHGGCCHMSRQFREVWTILWSMAFCVKRSSLTEGACKITETCLCVLKVVTDLSTMVSRRSRKGLSLLDPMPHLFSLLVSNQWWLILQDYNTNKIRLVLRLKSLYFIIHSTENPWVCIVYMEDVLICHIKVLKI